MYTYSIDAFKKVQVCLYPNSGKPPCPVYPTEVFLSWHPGFSWIT